MIAYLDSSVVLRVVLGQRNRLREWKRVREGVASALVEVECLRTLDRLRLRAGLSDRDLAARREAVFRLLEEMSVVEPGRPILSRASQPFPTPLGTLDAIHLATALAWRDGKGADLVMATHDGALGTAARALGLHVVGLS
jgi:predicted nucleic acid-binding protein